MAGARLQGDQARLGRIATPNRLRFTPLTAVPTAGFRLTPGMRVGFVVGTSFCAMRPGRLDGPDPGTFDWRLFRAGDVNE